MLFDNMLKILEVFKMKQKITKKMKILLLFHFRKRISIKLGLLNLTKKRVFMESLGIKLRNSLEELTL